MEIGANYVYVLDLICRLSEIACIKQLAKYVIHIKRFFNPLHSAVFHNVSLMPEHPPLGTQCPHDSS